MSEWWAKDSVGTPYAITSPGKLGTIASWQDILWNIYFSITTFSTIMDGGLAPIGPWTRIVVAVESITGALLAALLVFVLGRRVADKHSTKQAQAHRRHT